MTTQALIDAAQGRIPCDLLIQGVRFLDVFSCEWRSGDVAVKDGHIVGIEAGLKAERTLRAQGQTLVPGFIDAHVHVESSLLTPENFEAAVLPRGTTTAICDPHELANVMGVEGIRYFLDASQRMALDLRVMLSSCVPATHLETNGGGVIEARDLAPLIQHPRALGLAEMMNVPGVLAGDPAILEKLALFAGRPLDGHCPLVSGQALSAYAAAGISSCHESSRLDEAQEKLTKGISIWIREGSVAKDLQALAPLLTLATSTSVGFCTDDRNPLDIAREGHLDHLIRGAIARGVPAAVAYRAASWSVARHYGLARIGAIAPGYRADLVLLEAGGEALQECRVAKVLRAGRESGEALAERKQGQGLSTPNTIHASIPEASAFEGPAGNVHVIGVRAGRILTERTVESHQATGVARLSVIERHGKGSHLANAYVRGFGTEFRGAIASSVGHDSHNLIVAGSSTSDMRMAVATLAECGGGFSVVQDGKVLARLELPFGGLMTSQSVTQVEGALRKLHAASHQVRCELPEPFLQLAFLSLPVIPSLKLTDKGLVDVDAFQIIDVRAS